MSEQTILEIMDHCQAAADLAKVDVAILWVAMIAARPSSLLSESLEMEIQQRAMRRSEGVGA